MKKSIVVVLIMTVVLVLGGCYENDPLDKNRDFTLKVFGDSNAVLVNGNYHDLTVSPYEEVITVKAEKITNEDYMISHYKFEVNLNVKDESGSFTVINAEIWNEENEIVKSGTVGDYYESVNLYYKNIVPLTELKQ